MGAIGLMRSLLLLICALACHPGQAQGVGDIGDIVKPQAITGIYRGDDGSVLYLLQRRAEVFAFAEHPGRQYAVVARGGLLDDKVKLDWWDVRKGLQSQSGELDAALLKPSSAIWNREIKIKQTGATRASMVEPDYAVDFKAMGKKIEQVVTRSGAVGWAYAIATPAGVVKKGAGGNRQLKVDGAERKFTSRTLAQAGSVSKTATAIALAKALHGRSVPFNTPISLFLPPCWKPGKGIDASLSFGDLASHNTGFEDAGSSDYQSVKQVIENGNVREPSGRVYRNANYRVMRYLVPLVAQREKAPAIFSKWDCKDSKGEQINLEISKLFAQILLEDTLPASVSSGMAFVPTSGDFSLNYNWQDASVSGSPPNPQALEKAGAGYLAQSAGRAAWKNGGVQNNVTGRALAAWAVVFAGRTYAYLVMNSGRKTPSTDDSADLGAILRASYDAAFK